MRHLDLFSGIGGFTLAAQWAGIQTVAFAEVNDWCVANALSVNWPEIPNLGDVQKLCRRIHHQLDETGHDYDPDYVECSRCGVEFGECDCIGTDQFTDRFGGIDLVTAGVPCQPASLIGKRKGAGYGPIPCESSGNSNPPGSSAKTPSESSPSMAGTDSVTSSRGFMKQGILVGGKLSPLQPLAWVIGGNGSGLLPTPAARDWKDTPGMARQSVDKSGKHRSRLDQLHRRLFFLCGTASSGGKINLQYRLWLMGYPIQHTTKPE